MATRRKDLPDLFADTAPDPVESATGRRKPSPPFQRAVSTAAKKKAGFYLSVDILERFTLKFHELKLAGVSVDNKSALLELALSFALDDLDKGNNSRVLQKLG
jgi:hypothetical protein